MELDTYIQTKQKEISNIKLKRKNTEFENDELLDFYSNWMNDFTLKQSNSSFNLDDIQNFSYGPYTSRFWMLRKHILLLDKKKFMEKPTFFGWNCITIKIKEKWDVHLVFGSERSCQNFLKLLIHRLESVDGKPGSQVKLKSLLLSK